MGFWQGMNEGLTYVLDKRAAKESEERGYAYDREKEERGYAYDREKFERGLLEARREAYLKLIAEYSDAKKAREAMATKAQNLGLSETAVGVLSATGELELLMDQYDKNARLDPKFVRELGILVEAKLKDMPPEVQSRALLLGVSTDRDTSDPREAAIASHEAILNATSSEELDALAPGLYGSTGTVALPPVGIDFGYASGASSEDTKKIANELAAKLRPYFQDSFREDPNTGEIRIRQDAPQAVLSLFNTAEEKARSLAFGPARVYTPTDAAAEVAKAIEVVAPRVPAADILKNLDAILVDPQAYVPDVRIPEPASGTTTERTVEGMGDALTGSDFDSIVDNNNTRD